MRIVFMGTPEFAAASLEQLLTTRHEVVGVFTQPDKPKGRGYKPVSYTHLDVYKRQHQFRQILSSSEPVGRKLDFLVQEFNREANTIGSKAQDLEIARIVVDLKSEIEKIREQIQNIE